MASSTKSSQLLDAVDWAIAQNSDKASIYYNKIDISKVGVAGHSCGGLQALEVSIDPRITTTIVVDSGILNSGGYRYGVGDQAFYVPAIVQHLNTDLFPRDRLLLHAQDRFMVLDDVAAGLAACGILHALAWWHGGWW